MKQPALVFVACALALAVAGCGTAVTAPTAQAEMPEVIVLGAQPQANPLREDTVQAHRRGDSTVVEVYHARGIGGALLHAPARGWPDSTVVRLHGFPELEGFSAKAAASALVCEMTRPGSRPPVQKCRLDGADVDALRETDGVYEIALPQALLRAADTPVELRWVDYWR